MTTTAEENKRIVRRIREEIEEQGNLDAVEEIFAEDAVVHGPMQEFRGHEEIKASFEMDRGAFSDYTETVEEMIAEGDIVALRLSERGTHDGPLQGIEPTGNAFEIQTMAFLRLEGGKVVEWWIQPDMLGFLQQLEVDPEDLGAAVSAEDD